MSEASRFGLSAAFSFDVPSQTQRSVNWVIDQLGAIETAVNQASQTINTSQFGGLFQQQAEAAASGTQGASQAVKQMTDTAKVARQRLRPLKDEFRAIRAATRNLNFGDLSNDRQFRRASEQARVYIRSIRELEHQVQGTSAVEREFTEVLKRQAVALKTQLDLQKQQRDAAAAAERTGQFQALRTIGKTAIKPLYKEGEKAVQVFQKFDDQMSELAAVSGASGAALDSLRKKSTELGAETRFSSTESAGALTALASAGFTVEEMLTGVNATLNMASAGSLDLEESASIAANTLRGMKLKVEDLSHVTDVLAYTAAATNSNIQQTAVALEYAGPAAATFTASLEQTTSIIGAMSNAGIAADKAGTAMRAMFLRLANPPKKGKEAIAEFGLQLTDSKGDMLDILDVLQQVSDKLQLDPAALKDIAAIAEDDTEALEKLGVSQSRQITALSGLFGTTAVSGAAAAISQIQDIKRLNLAAQAASTPTEELVNYFTKLKGLEIKPKQDLFAAIIENAPSYTDAVAEVNEANLNLMEGHLRSLDPKQMTALRSYFVNVKGMEIDPQDNLLASISATAPTANAAISEVTAAMDNLGIRLNREAGAAKTMALVMENNLAGSFRSLSSAFEAVQIGLIEPLAPLIRSVVDALTKFLLFIANLPAPIRSTIATTAALVTGLAALAVAVGFVGAGFFGFSQALATSNAAAIALSRSAIPLTGFFSSSMDAFRNTNPIEGLARTWTRAFDDFGGAVRGNIGSAGEIVSEFRNRTIQALRATLLLSRAFLLSPLGIGISAFLILNTVISQLAPELNLLGTILSALAAPFGFLFGLVKGLTDSVLNVFGTSLKGAFTPILPVINSITAAVEQAMQTFTLFSEKGETVGKLVGDVIVRTLQNVGATITSIWNSTIEAIARPLIPFVNFVKEIGYKLVGFLAEHSPGTTWLIRHAWAYTVEFIQGLFGRLQAIAGKVMEKFRQIAPVLHNSILPLLRLGAALANLMRIVDPVHAILVSAGALVVSAIIEIMNSSLKEGIKITFRTLASLVAIEGSIAISQGLIGVGAYLKTVFTALIASVFGQIVVDHFEQISQTIVAAWVNTFSFIVNIVSRAATRLREIGRSFVSFLAENSPGPTFLIRQAWAFTANFLLAIFRNLEMAALATGQFLVTGFQAALPTLLNLTRILGGFLRGLLTLENIPGFLALGVIFGFIVPKIVQAVHSLMDLGTIALPQVQTAIAPVVAIAHKLGDALSILNTAFIGIGDPTSDERLLARQHIFQGFINTVLSGVKSLASVGQFFTWLNHTEHRLIQAGIDNFDYLSFTLLTLASLPMTLMGRLEAGFQYIIPELAMFASHGIPQAILYALPAAVAAAMSMGLIKGFQKGFSDALDSLPSLVKDLTNNFYTLFSPEMMIAINAGVTEGVQGFMRALPLLFTEAQVDAFFFDFTGPTQAIYAFADGPLVQFIGYLHKIGDTANLVSERLHEILDPLLNFHIGQIYSSLNFLPPVIPSLLVLEPLIYKAIPNLLASPALQGIIGFLSGTVLPAVAQTLGTVGTTLAYIVGLLASPVIVIFGGGLKLIYDNVAALIKILPQLARQFVLAVGNYIANQVLRLTGAIAALIARIPYIGEALARVFLTITTFIVTNFPKYLQLLVRAFEPVFRQIMRMASAWRLVMREILRGVEYFIDEGLRPLGPILAKLLDPRSAFRLLNFYLRTQGFKGVIKGGIFGLSPFDLLFGGKIPFFSGMAKAFVFGRKIFLQSAFPLDIIAAKQREMFNILADPLAKAKASRFKMLASMADIMENVEKMGPGYKFVLELFRGVMLVSPWVQILARIGLSLLFWYTILKPLNQEMITAIANTEVFGHKLTLLAVAIQTIRFAVIAATETMLFLAKYLPKAFMTSLWIFDKLGVVMGVTVHEIIAIFTIFTNIFKATVINALLVIPLAAIAALEGTLIVLRQNLMTLRAMTQRYGDVIAQLFAGDMSKIGVILGYLFEDIVVNTLNNAMWLVENTLGRLVNSVIRIFRGIGGEIYRLITNPAEEIRRLIGLTVQFVDRVLGAALTEVATYVKLLQLDRLVNFLWTIKYAIAAITPVVLYLFGALNPMLFVASVILEGILGLIYEYQTGFKELDALIQGLQHPIEALNSLLNIILSTFNIYISPGVSEFIGGLAAQFVKFIPVIAAGIFLVALLVRRDIGAAFATVTETVRALKGAITGVGDSVRDAFERPKTQIFLKELSHNVRTRQNVAGVKNPFMYSQDPQQQQYARNLRQQELGKAKAAMRYREEINKQVEKAQDIERKRLFKYYKSNLASERQIAHGGSVYNPETGQSFTYAARVEKKRDLLGREKLELTDSGRAYAEKEARRTLLKGTSDQAVEMRQKAAQRAGLEFQFKEYAGGKLPPSYDMALRDLAQPDDVNMKDLLKTFQDAMKNLHVKEFQADRFYVSNYRVPDNLPTNRPANGAAFDLQLEKLRSNMPQTLSQNQRQGIDRISTAKDVRNRLFVKGQDKAPTVSNFKGILDDTGIDSDFMFQGKTYSEFVSQYSTDLKTAASNKEKFALQLDKTVDKLIQIQSQYIGSIVGSFNDFQEANLEIAQSGDAIRGIPVATGFDAFTQGVKNIANQAQAGAGELEDGIQIARKSLPALIFGFTGIPQLLEQIESNKALDKRIRQVTNRTQRLVDRDLNDLEQERRRRERGMRNLIANAYGGFDFEKRREPGGFYEMKKFTDAQKAFLEDFLTGQRSLNNLVRNVTDKEKSGIKTAFGSLKMSTRANPMEDLYKAIESSGGTDEQRNKARKMLNQFLRHGAENVTAFAGPSAVSEKDFNELKTWFSSVLGKAGGAGNLSNFYNSLGTENRKIVAQYLQTGKELVKITDDEKKDLAKSLGLSIGVLKRLSPQVIPLNNFFESIRQSVDYFFEDYRDRIVLFGAAIKTITQKAETRLKMFLPDSLVDPLFKRIYRFYDDFGKSFMHRYDTARQNLQKNAEDFIKSVRDSKLVSAFRRASEEYQNANKFNLKTLMSQGKPAEYVNVKEDVNGSMIDVRRNVGGAKNRAELQSRVIKELQNQGFSQKEANQAMLAILERGGEGQETIAKRLKRRTDPAGRELQKELDADKVASAFAKALMVPVERIKTDIMNNPDYTARASRPFQGFLLREFPAVMVGLVTGVTTIAQRAAKTAIGQTIGRITRIIIKDITLGLGNPILSGLSKTSLFVGNVLAKGFNRLAEGAFDIIGPNPFSNVLNHLSDFFLNTGRRTAGYLSKTQGEIGKAFSLTGTIVGFITKTFSVVAESFGKIYAEAQRTNWLVAIKKAFVGVGRFFKNLLPKNNQPLPNQDQIDQAKRRVEVARRFEAMRKAPGFQQRFDFANTQLDRNRQRLEQLKQQRERDFGAKGATSGLGGGPREQALNSLIDQMETRVKGLEYTKRALLMSPDLEQQNVDSLIADQRRTMRQQNPVLRIFDAITDQIKRSPNRALKGLGSIFKRISEKLPTSTDYKEFVRKQRTRMATTSFAMGGERRSGEVKTQTGFNLEANIKRSVPLVENLYKSLTTQASMAAFRVSEYFTNSAKRSESAWDRSALAITGKSWFSMVKRAIWTGVNIVTNLNHGAADVTAAAWQRTEASTQTNMQQMATNAEKSGEKIEAVMTETAQAGQHAAAMTANAVQEASNRSIGFLGRIGQSIGGVGKAGVAIGGAITATGFGLQTLTYSLSNMGLVGEETSQQLNKFFEIFTILGAVGGIITPILAAIGTSLGAIGTLAATAATAISAIGGVIAPLIGLGGFALAPLFIGIATLVAAAGGLYLIFQTNFLGIRTLAEGIGGQLAHTLSAPIAIIERFWLAFVERFQPILQPVIDIAQKIGTGIVGFLNHGAADVTAAAWQRTQASATENMQQMGVSAAAASADISSSFQQSTEQSQGFLQRIQSIFGSVGNFLVGAGAATGSAIAGFFSPVTNLFKKKEKPSEPLPVSDAAQPAVPGATPPQSPIAGFLGLVSGPIGIIKSTIEQIVTTISQPIDWMAETIAPLQRSVAFIASFFRSLVSIIQSIAYLNRVLGPMSQQGAAITQTISSIADFLYNIRSIVESLEFLYLKFTQFKGWWHDKTQRPKSEADITKTVPPDHKDPDAGKSPRTRIKEVVGLKNEVTSVIDNVQTIQKAAPQVQSAFGGAMQFIGSAWQNTVGRIGKHTDDLVTTSQDQGYELQKAIAEGSPGPTYWIRQHWGTTTELVKHWLGELATKAVNVGETIEEKLLTSGIRDRYQFLKREGVGELGALFKPGIQDVGSHLQILLGDFGEFAKRGTKALLTLNFVELSSAAADFGGNFAWAAKGIIGGFGSMTSSAIAFGMYGVAAITPFLVIFAGVAFTAAVLFANFLGLRTVILGTFRVGIGITQIFLAVVKGVVKAIGAIRDILFGLIRGILTGDFKQLVGGFESLKLAFVEMGRGILRGMGTVGQGIRQILIGIVEGIEQLFAPLGHLLRKFGVSLDAIGIQFKRVLLIFKDGEKAGEWLADTLIRGIKSIVRAIAMIPIYAQQAFTQLKKTVQGAIIAATQTINNFVQFLRNLDFSQIFKTISRQISSTAANIRDTLFEIPKQAIRAIKNIAPGLLIPFIYIRDFIKGFLGRVFQELPPELAEKFRASWQRIKDRLVSPIKISFDLNAIKELTSRFTKTLGRVSERWTNFQKTLASSNIFSGFFDGLRDLGNRFVLLLGRIEQKWIDLKLPGLPVIQKVITQLTNLKLRFDGFVDYLQNKWAALTRWLSQTSLVGDAITQFERLKTKISAVMNSAAGWRLPANFEELRKAFTSTVNRIEQGWKSLVTWLTATPLFPDLFTTLQKAGIAFVRFTRNLATRWDNFQKYLITNNPLVNLFKSLREATRLFLVPFIWLENKWRSLNLPGLPIIEKILNPVFKAKQGIDTFFDALETQWLKLKTFLSTTNLVGGAIQGLEYLSKAFIGVIRQIRSGWTPFVTFLSTGKVFPQFFEALRNLPDTAKAAIAQIEEAWQGFVSRFRTVMAPVVEFARWVAEKIIAALNCHATVVIPSAWERAVTRIIELIEKIIAPVRAVAETIIGVFQSVTRFIVSFGKAFYQAVVPIFGRVDDLMEHIRKGTLSVSSLGNVTGIASAWSRLLVVLEPMVTGLRSFSKGLSQTNQSTGKATTLAQKLGQVVGKAAVLILEFALKVTPPLLKVLGLIIQIGLEVAIFGVKVAYALREGVFHFVRLGTGVYEAFKNVVQLVASIVQAPKKIAQAFNTLKADIKKFKDSLVAGFTELGSALGKLAVAILDVFAPQLKPYIKEAISLFGHYTTFAKTAVSDLLDSSLQAYRDLGTAITSFSPFELLEKGAIAARGVITNALAFIESALEKLGINIDFSQIGKSLNAALDPVRRIFGLLGNEAKSTGDTVAQNVTGGFAKVTDTLRESLQKTVNLYLSGFNDIGDHIKSFIGFYATAFGELTTSLIVSVTEFGDRVIQSAPVQYLVGQFEALQRVASGVFGAIVTFISPVVDRIQELAVALGLNRYFELIGEQVTTLKAAVVSAIEVVADAVTERVQRIAQVFGDRFSGIKTLVVGVFDTVSGTIRSVLDTLSGGFKGTFGEIQATVMRAAQPYEPIIGALREVFQSVAKIGTAFGQLILDITLFGVKVDTIITNIIGSLGRVLFSLIEITGEIFFEGGIIRVVRTFLEISSAVKDLTVSLANMAINAIPPLARFKDAIVEYLQAPLKAIAALWESTGGKIVGAIQKVTGTAKTEGEVITQAVGEEPAKKTRNFWQRTTKQVSADITQTVEKAAPQGHELQASISEGSPGPTYWIRQHWARTANFLDQKMVGLSATARSEGDRIHRALDSAFNSVSSSGLEQNALQVSRLSQNLVTDATNKPRSGRGTPGAALDSEALNKQQEQLKGLGQAGNSVLMSMGGALSNFAPQLATPFYMVNDFVDVFASLQDATPQVKAFFAATNVATSTSATSYGALGRAADMAYTSMIKPLIGFLPWILAISVAVFFLYQVFKNNFGGIGKLLETIGKGFQFFFNTLFAKAWDSVVGVFRTLDMAIQSVLRTIGSVASKILEPFEPILNFLGFGAGYSYGYSGARAIVGLINLILVPLRLVTNTLNFIITTTAGVINIVIRLAGAVISFLLLPLAAVVAVIEGIFKGFQRMGEQFVDMFNAAILAPTLWAMSIGNTIISIFQRIGKTITDWVLYPFIALGNLLQPLFNSVKRIIDFIIPPVLAIGAAIAAVFFLLNGGLPGILSFLTLLAVVAVPLLVVALGLLVFVVQATVMAVVTALGAAFTFITATLIPGLITAVMTGLSVLIGVIVPAIVSAISFLITVIVPLAFSVLSTVVPILMAIITPIFAAIGSMAVTAATALIGVLVPALGAVFAATIPIMISLAPFVLGIMAVAGAVLLIKLAFDGVVGVVKWLWGLVQQIVQGIVGLLSHIPIIGGLFQAKPQPTQVQALAAGGPVQGPGTSTGDRVLIAASPNEFMVNAASTAANYGLLEAINNGAVFTPVTAVPPTPIMAPPPVSGSISVAAPTVTELPPMEFNFNFGDIVLSAATGVEAAKDFLDAIDPILQRKMRDLLRDLVEKTK